LYLNLGKELFDVAFSESILKPVKAKRKHGFFPITVVGQGRKSIIWA